MRVLYVAMRHDYGDPRRGLSFEETNFRTALEGIGHDLLAFDFMERERVVGREAMRVELVALAGEARPDLTFCFLFTDEIDPATIQEVRRATRAPVVNWFADDHWRFDSFTRHYAPAFDLAITTDPDTMSRYRVELPEVRVHLSQWACNRYSYRRVEGGLRHGVTFVGQPHGERRRVIDELCRGGIEVECWGHGWSGGRLEHEQMIEVFSSSAINLNLSNSSDVQSVRTRVWRLLGQRVPVRPAQIKGRNFEVPGCGGFLLTERLPHLEEYFGYDEEIGVYTGTGELIERVRFWLDHPAERLAVAEAGHRRVLAEHTYDHRFAEIVRILGESNR
jgi:spore maturation protein CgeB